MTSIKPPDGKTPGAGSASIPAGPAGSDGPGGVRRSEPAGPAFNDALDAVQRAPEPAASQVGGATATGSADPIAELARAVRSGSLEPAQALDRLVERAASSMSRSLSPAQRAELTSVLRAALQTDPALAALRDAIGS